MSDTEAGVRDNRALSQFELVVDGEIALAAYELHEGSISFTHTKVPEALEGRGVASRLIKGALADVRERGLKVVPLCEFVAAYFDRHPEEKDLLATHAPG